MALAAALTSALIRPTFFVAPRPLTSEEVCHSEAEVRKRLCELGIPNASAGHGELSQLLHVAERVPVPRNVLESASVPLRTASKRADDASCVCSLDVRCRVEELRLVVLSLLDSPAGALEQVDDAQTAIALLALAHSLELRELERELIANLTPFLVPAIGCELASAAVVSIVRCEQAEEDGCAKAQATRVLARALALCGRELSALHGSSRDPILALLGSLPSRHLSALCDALPPDMPYGRRRAVFNLEVPIVTAMPGAKHASVEFSLQDDLGRTFAFSVWARAVKEAGAHGCPLYLVCQAALPAQCAAVLLELDVCAVRADIDVEVPLAAMHRQLFTSADGRREGGKAGVRIGTCARISEQLNLRVPSRDAFRRAPPRPTSLLLRLRAGLSGSTQQVELVSHWAASAARGVRCLRRLPLEQAWAVAGQAEETLCALLEHVEEMEREEAAKQHGEHSHPIGPSLDRFVVRQAALRIGSLRACPLFLALSATAIGKLARRVALHRHEDALLLETVHAVSEWVCAHAAAGSEANGGAQAAVVLEENGGMLSNLSLPELHALARPGGALHGACGCAEVREVVLAAVEQRLAQLLGHGDKDGAGDDIPPWLLCPISQDLFEDPVLLVGDGQTYSRKKLEHWLSIKQTSPMNNTRLTAEQAHFVRNQAIYCQVNHFRQARQAAAQEVQPHLTASRAALKRRCSRGGAELRDAAETMLNAWCSGLGLNQDKSLNGGRPKRPRLDPPAAEAPAPQY